jgi:hypothetical protein
MKRRSIARKAIGELDYTRNQPKKKAIWFQLFAEGIDLRLVPIYNQTIPGIRGLSK